MMHAIVDVVDTPHGPFTMLADDDGAVLGAGWNTTVDDVVARVHVQLRPSGVTAGRVHAAEAVRAYYGGDIAAPGRVQVRQHGTDLQNAGWQRLRDVAPGQTKTYAEFADELGQDPGDRRKTSRPNTYVAAATSVMAVWGCIDDGCQAWHCPNPPV